MIYDMRTYDLRPGGLQEYMAAVREIGLPVREKHGIKLAGWYHTEFGRLNRVVHIWAFRDWEHLVAGKDAFRKDPAWVNEYVPRVMPLIVAQRSEIVQAADFSPEPG